MNRRFICTGLVAALTVFSPLRSPEKISHCPVQQTDCDCSRISREEGHKILVTYERMSRRGSGRGIDTVWLRLRNGTDCAIYLPTDHGYGTITKTGDLKADIQDGSVVFVLHEVRRTGRKRSTTGTRGERWLSFMGGTKFATRLPAGNSLVLYLPIANLKGGSEVAFRYVCREDSPFDVKAPRVLFDLRKLPDSVPQAR